MTIRPGHEHYCIQQHDLALRKDTRRLAALNTAHLAWLDAALDLPELTRLAAAQHVMPVPATGMVVVNVVACPEHLMRGDGRGVTWLVSARPS
jgi:hypothetical protein